MEYMDGVESLTRIYLRDSRLLAQNLTEPFDWRLGYPCQVVVVVNVVETKSYGVPWVPLPIIKQWPHKVAMHIATFLPEVIRIEEMMSVKKNLNAKHA